jgi:hypothetical protein
LIKKNWRILFLGLILILDSWISVLELKPKEKDFGFLSLNRAIALDSMDLDLSRELSKPSKATLDRQVAVARQMAAGAATAKRADENKPKWRFAPTKREEEQWARAKKAVSGGTVCCLCPPFLFCVVIENISTANISL